MDIVKNIISVFSTLLQEKYLKTAIKVLSENVNNILSREKNLPICPAVLPTCKKNFFILLLPNVYTAL